jgi:hypothetical protein
LRHSHYSGTFDVRKIANQKMSEERELRHNAEGSARLVARLTVMRPWQWVKNGNVAPVFFAGHALVADKMAVAR